MFDVFNANHASFGIGFFRLIGGQIFLSGPYLQSMRAGQRAERAAVQLRSCLVRRRRLAVGRIVSFLWNCGGGW